MPSQSAHIPEETPPLEGLGRVNRDRVQLRYVALRFGNKKGERFEDGSRMRHFAILLNRWELTPARLIEWQQEKAGTVERVHDVTKNELGGVVRPWKYFRAHAAWRRLAAMTHHGLTAWKRLALPPDLLTVRPKRLRFLIFNTPGRRVHHAGRRRLRRAALAEWIAA